MKLVTEFMPLNPYYFWKKEPFTQWTVSDKQFVQTFDDGGDTYFNCCEQYMMFMKANIFNDHNMMETILRAKHPRQQKALGREVKNFKEDHWEKNKLRIVYDATKLKFNQNPEWKAELINKVKEGYYFVEASPFDTVWGIGIDPDAAKAGVKWKGENLLGIILTNVAMEYIRDEQRIWQDDINYAPVPAIDALQEYLKSKGIDTELPLNTELIENQLHDIIWRFIEEHYSNGNFSNYN